MNRVLVIGDLILDKYDYCINRENPESSAPCYTVNKIEYKLGGAGNVAANLRSLGSSVKLISVLGDDPNGAILNNLLLKEGIDNHLIFDLSKLTPVKERILSAHDNRYHYRKDIENNKCLGLEHIPQIIKIASNSSVILISDYNKGIVSKELIEQLKLLKIPIIVDPKPSNILFYNGVFLIKPNLKELFEITKISDPLVAAQELSNMLNTKVLLTRGKDGVSYFGETRFDLPSNANDVFDVTGAGDTFIATFVHFFNKGYKIINCIELANKAAGISVAYPGCYQITEKELL